MFSLQQLASLHHLSNLTFSPAEAESTQQSLLQLLALIEPLQNVSLPPPAAEISEASPLREDFSVASLPVSEALQNAAVTEESYFVAPKGGGQP